MIGFSSWLLRAATSGGGVDDGDDDSRSLFVRATGMAIHSLSLAGSDSSTRSSTRAYIIPSGRYVSAPEDGSAGLGAYGSYFKAPGRDTLYTRDGAEYERDRGKEHQYEYKSRVGRQHAGRL